MSINFKIPKIQISLFLFLIFLSSLVFNPSVSPLIGLAIILVVNLGTDYLLLLFRKIEPFLLSGALVSGFVMVLLQDPNSPTYELVLVAALAMFSKNFIRNSESHIFNPAAFGLFFTSLLFNHNVSWWAVSFQSLTPFSLIGLIYFLILLSPGYVSLYKMRRFRNTLTFLICYFLFNLFNRGVVSLDPTVIFFSLVMLPEPATTPFTPFRQILFGGFVAVAVLLVSNFSFLPDPLIFSLLLANLIFFKFK